ncbi:putative RNA methyltransferase [Pseudohongiella sp. O18]|uniref:putative RNA methyltransferase n=1 Tax=Pseudohongiella sp. O18 TaxID=2904248 RepID=UPI001F285879|nr:methyltransferase domain-containing protein [Pseudohongiella sp. O18]
MAVTAFTQLACPLDGEPLQREDNTWRCSKGHSFDVARQGYVNLLPVQNKRSRDPGDSKAMVVARQEFLAAGFYQPIAQAVAGAILNGVTSSATLNCLDAGCGEGYYLRQLAAQCQPDQSLTVLGLDISKWAVQAAARQDRHVQHSEAASVSGQGAAPVSDAGTKNVSWVVGNNANLPVLPATLDRILCMFGFPGYPEFLRVLKPGGKLLMVDAGADHLRELREIIYPTLKPARPPQNQAPAGFVMGDIQQLRFSVRLPDAKQIGNLLVMTPHLYRASAEGRARAEQLTELQLTVDVRLTTLIKDPVAADPDQQ